MILEKVFKKLDDVIYIDSANSEYEGNIYITTKKNGIQQSNLRSQCYKFDLDKHPLDVSCQEQAAKGNVQFLVTNAKNGRIDIGTLQRFNHVSVERRCSTCQQI